jgi:hypothetical protein
LTNHHDQRRSDDCRKVQSAADRQSHRSDGPQAGRGGQPANHLLAQKQDGAGAQEADAADHLCRDPRGIEHNAIGADHVVEAVGGHDHDQRGSEAYEHVRAQPRHPFQPLALQSDGRAERRGEHQSQNDVLIWEHGRVPACAAHAAHTIRG